MSLDRNEIAIRGEILYFLEDPAEGATTSVRHLADGILCAKDGLVVECVEAKSSKHSSVAKQVDGLIVPGFVDTHVHYPQLGIIASYGTELMEWLDRYTFPHEAAFADPGLCASEAETFLDMMLACGTTTALVFATSHQCSANALFEKAYDRNVRLVTGKVLSDCNVPEEIRDSPKRAFEESTRLIERWHNKGRLGYAITPRFAPTSSKKQLEVAGKLLEENPGTLLHTHYSESAMELKAVKELFPDAKDYLEVYEKAGLVTDRSVFAHAIHPTRSEWDRLGKANCAIAHCPCSNLFIGSGLFNIAEATTRGIRIGLGSDVGGGNSLAMPRVMDEAYKVARMAGCDIDPYRLWYLATLGGARALGLEDRIGSFKKGSEADFIVLDPTAMPMLEKRLESASDLAERLFAMAALGDERIVREVYLMGNKVV